MVRSVMFGISLPTLVALAFLILIVIGGVNLLFPEHADEELETPVDAAPEAEAAPETGGPKDKKSQQAEPKSKTKAKAAGSSSKKGSGSKKGKQRRR